MEHRFPIRVYYEDTDLAGVVYYANYLRYIERARSDLVRQVGLDQMSLRADRLVFAVTRVEADYLKPAQFDDALVVVTSAQSCSGARFVLEQVVMRGNDRLFAAIVSLAAMSPEGKPRRLPAALVAALRVD